MSKGRTKLYVNQYGKTYAIKESSKHSFVSDEIDYIGQRLTFRGKPVVVTFDGQGGYDLDNKYWRAGY